MARKESLFPSESAPAPTLAPALAPTRSSALESVVARQSTRYPRRAFYLKIEGLEGPRPKADKGSKT